MFIPKLIVCLREGYSWSLFRADAAAGMVVGLVALPLAMAFSIASGLPPERGIYTAIVAGFLISALGGSRVQIGGPTGAFVVIVAGIVAHHGYSGLALATLLAGVMLIAMGVTRLGEWVRHIPEAVTVGFTSGIAVVIFSSQLRDYLGLQLPGLPADAIGQWKAAGAALSTWNPWAFGIALMTTLTVLYWPKAWQKCPGPLVALVGASVLVALAAMPIETIGSRFGSIPNHLPVPQWPGWTMAQVVAVFPGAIALALLGAIESLLSAVVADGMSGGRHKSNLELVAQGVANIASPLFGGIPATGAIARTATNVRNGARTPIAGMIHALVLLLILLLAGPWAAHIPLAVLSGILVVVCFHMADVAGMRRILRLSSRHATILLATFAVTIIWNLILGIVVGVVLSVLLNGGLRPKRDASV